MGWAGGGCRVNLPDKWEDLMAPILTRWLNLGLTQEREDPDFRSRLDELDRAISNPGTLNATMRNVAR